VVDAVCDGTADGHDHAGDDGQLASQLDQELLLRAVAELDDGVDLRGVDVLRVLVELRSAGAAVGGDHLGKGEQDLLDAAAEAVGFLERGAGHGHSADRERALVELRQEGAAEEGEDGERSGQEDPGQGDRGPRAGEGGAEGWDVGALEVANHVAIAMPEPSHARQEVRAEDGRQSQRDEERGEDGDEIGEAERVQETAFHAREEEERDEDQHHDERGEDDRPAYLARGVEDDVGGRTLA
jgi:hypothetical protein